MVQPAFLFLQELLVHKWLSLITESRLERGGGVNRANLKFINLITTISRVSVRNINESEREGEKQIMSK
jgi:hypothetical protein